MKRPNKGGCYIRDPKTKALKPVSKEMPKADASAESSSSTPETNNAASKNATGKGK
ncbi:hypothetical protein JET14_11935 [Martelella lutilitoris]|uniref:Uncharacterized protein n=1 Tax=Martelella lutilitoris TaxID=2583532 RepID=A0A7T7HH50_9HYPH|nr:hypothetical protein [Martelella lutilitoris]QQM29050.1 hypothetical protein JET14_11935 [Martelella lutilitoris]